MGTTIGILAHVDAGKTTLAEQLLYRAGTLRAPGRVDRGTALLDHDAVERERGITVFADEAAFVVGNRAFHLLDTPGHADFSGEMERALWVMDAAILVVSGVEGVQSHTRTVWRLLRRQGIPTLIFCNKTDRAGADPARVLEQLRELAGPKDGPGVLPADGWTKEMPTVLAESLAELDDGLLETYLTDGYESQSWEAAARRLFLAGLFFPVLTGAALEGRGVEELLDLLPRLTEEPKDANGPLLARAYKVRHDRSLGRLTYLKVMSGTLRAKMPLSEEEKADRLLRPQGGRLLPLEQALPGDLCAVSGIRSLHPGQEAPGDGEIRAEALRPALSAQVLYPAEIPAPTMLQCLRELEDEEPLLGVRWDEHLQAIQVQVMGPVQLEVLERVIRERYGYAVAFGPCQILYRETIAAPVVGYGHFEPLRHYAEVHLRLSPGPRGSGIVFDSACPLDDLHANWQNLIRTHVLEREHMGVLTGSPLTDVRVTLLRGRSHLKHTEGGDFREAVRRAVRQGLMQAETVLLEPYYAFSIEVGRALCGRVLSDLQRMGGDCAPPETLGDRCALRGRVPVAAAMDYPREFAAFSRGEGNISLALDGYEPCRDQAAVAERLGYDALRDTEHPAESVFCTHGAGRTIPWDEAVAHMHLPID